MINDHICPLSLAVLQQIYRLYRKWQHQFSSCTILFTQTDDDIFFVLTHLYRLHIKCFFLCCLLYDRIDTSVELLRQGSLFKWYIKFKRPAVDPCIQMVSCMWNDPVTKIMFSHI